MSPIEPPRESLQDVYESDQIGGPVLSVLLAVPLLAFAVVMMLVVYRIVSTW